MNKIYKLYETKYGGLIFSLLSGIAYYIIVLYFLLGGTNSGGALLGFFFLPAIVCGMALVLFKTVKKLKETEALGRINLLIYGHIILILMSLVFLADIILY